MPAERRDSVPVKETPKTKREKDEKLEEALEEALDETFPASDPPAASNPSKSVGWEEPNKKG